MNYQKKFIIIVIAICLCTLGSALHQKLIATDNQKENTQPELKQAVYPIAPHYRPQAFNFDSEEVTFSKSQLDQHKKLYEGYVNKRNEIAKDLATVDRSNAAGITYSAFRSLKIAETFARNGSLLHELYFENLGMGTQIGTHTKNLLLQYFESVEKFKEDLMACASCSRGWVLTCYCLDEDRSHNFVLDAHNETVPALAIPILAVDIYEHAYMIDYGINRAQYLKDMWENINWDVVEKRVIKWLHKLQDKDDKLESSATL